MKELLAKLQQLERELSDEKGRFTLFALFEHPGGPIERWRLVVSAPWATDGIGTALLIAQRLQAKLTPEERVHISRVTPIRPNDPGLEEVLDAADVEHGLVKVYNRTFFDVDVERALFITCRRDPVPQSA